MNEAQSSCNTHTKLQPLSQKKNSDNYKDNLISTICCSLTSKNTPVQKFSLHLIPTQQVRPFVCFFSRSEDFKNQQCYMKPKPSCQLLPLLYNGLPYDHIDTNGRTLIQMLNAYY